MKGKKILLTGGAGFIGYHLTQALDKNNEIYIIDNLYRHTNNLAWMKKLKNVTFLEGDICDINILKTFIPKDLTHIIHLAAIAGVLMVRDNPVKATKTNLSGSINVIELADSLANLEHFIFFSSSEVYGKHANLVKETDVKLNLQIDEPRWTYAISKLAGEIFLYQYWQQFKMPITIIRPFNVYGPHQLGESAMQNFIGRALNNEPLKIRGSGEQKRSWCYIEDFIKMILLVLDNHKAIGEDFNIGNPSASCSVIELALMIIKYANSKSEVLKVPLKYDDVWERIPVIEKGERILGYTPQTNLEDGVRKTIQWYRRYSNEKGKSSDVQ